MIKKYLIQICVSIILCTFALPTFAQPDENELGQTQTIQIYTHLDSFVGKPTWLLIIRDLDNDQSMPYLFDFTRGDNFWVIFTIGRNYVITVSRLQISAYRSRTNTFTNTHVNDFCNLESYGHIIRGRSLYITLDGELSPNRDSYRCNVSSYANANFTIAKPNIAP